MCIDVLIIGQYIQWTIDGDDWKKATGSDGKIAKHERSKAHQKSASDFKARTTEQQSSVAVHLSQAYAERLQREATEKVKNRAVLCTIIDVIRFLARQNISFRGKDENANSMNRGNFLELIHFTAKYNAELDRWLQNHPGNVSWLSPQIQNEL